MSYIVQQAIETGQQVNLLSMIIETEIGRARFYILKKDNKHADIQCEFVEQLIESYGEIIQTHLKFKNQVLKMNKAKLDYFKEHDEEWKEKHST